MQTLIDTVVDIKNFFVAQIQTFSVNDFFDILIVSVIIYFLIKFTRDRRAGKLALGIVFLFILRFIGEVFNFLALQFLLQIVFQVGIIAVVIVFQPELRDALDTMGGESLRGLKNIAEQKKSQSAGAMINDLCEALFDLSKDKTGALVVIERTTKLGEIIKTGVLVNADVSPFLLKTIFYNGTALHDGAVIVRDNRIYAAGCFLPLSTKNDIIKNLGTRHRAAIGMSENSDALVLVVSEETGTISMAKEGTLQRGYDYMSLRRELNALLAGEDEGAKKNPIWRAFSKKNAGADVNDDAGDKPEGGDDGK